MSGLNPAQYKAVHQRSGPMLVLAGAGSGKTRVVTFRIAELIRQGTPANRIMAVTFTNKAANEMVHRVRQVLGRQLESPPLIATFHSYCLQVLRRRIHHLGYPARFTIFDYNDQISVARNVLRDISVNDQGLRAGDFLQHVSDWKTRGIRPDRAGNYAETDQEHLAALAFRRYQRSLINMGAVDFDDLLLCVDDLFTQHPDIRQEESDLFDHLLVDEYQDTNGTQYRLIKALAAKHRNLCVVGDDDQSIYAWRGAEVRHILSFARDWPEAQVIKLEDNYRSTQAIIQIANRLISYNKVRHDKVLKAARQGGEKPRILQFKNEEEEAKEVVRDIRNRIQQPGLEPRDFALLFRTKEQPRAFETEFRKANVPYVLIGGKSFFDRAEIRTVLAYLKTITSPRDDVSLLRIINNPPRGIGMKTIEAIRSQAVADGASVWQTMASGLDHLNLANAPRQAVAEFVRLIRSFREKSSESFAAKTRRLLDKIQFQAEIERQYKSPLERETRAGFVEELIKTMINYEKNTKKPSLAKFVDDMTLQTQDFESGKDTQLQQNAVALMTLHSAKGLEFPHVYMVGMEEGILPHHRNQGEYGDNVEEERRLCYVGITRAQDRLTLSMPLTRVKWGKPRETQPSRFLYEIIGQADRPHDTPPAPSSSPSPTPKSSRSTTRSGKTSKRKSSKRTKR